jgi:hypothetical protein
LSVIAIALIVSACIFAGGLFGLLLHRLLPERHLTKETADVVRLATGMLSVLASLVLGLLVATVKTSYDSTDHSIRGYSADLILLHETLRDYGKDAAAQPISLLRAYTERVMADNWPKSGDRPPFVEDRTAGAMLERAREAIRALRPADAGQKWLQDQALQISNSLLQQRWLLIEQAGPTVHPIIVIILVSWITLIFISFGMNAPRNALVVVALLVCSLAIGGAIFLILEMDRPFSGVLQISSRPMSTAIEHMRE